MPNTTPPQIITALPSVSLENISNAGVATGFSGIITGIQTTTGVGGNPLALEFFISENPSITAAGIKKKEKKLGLKPGDPDWFKLWFSKPYMTGAVQFRGRKK